MTSKQYDFSGKVALVTGSSSGIGAAIVTRFAQCGAQVVITGYEENDVMSMVRKIEKITGTEPLWKVGDLTAPEFAESLVNETIEKYGKLDVLVNNAGFVTLGDSFLSSSCMSDFDKIIDLNLKCVVRMMHLAVQHLKRTRGCIINTSSVCGLTPLKKPIYCASKAAVEMVTKCAALEFGPFGIRVNSVSPGPIRTSIGRYIGSPNLMLGNECPETVMTIMKRNGEPEEVANVFMFLASEEASYITGATHVVDGGFMCH